MRKYLARFTDPTFQLRFNVGCFILTIVLLPTSIFFGWLNSVPFVSLLSVIALILSCLAAVVAALGLVAQAKAAESANQTQED